MYTNEAVQLGMYMYVHVSVYERVCFCVCVCVLGLKKVVAARLQAGSRLIHTEPECCPTAPGMEASECVCVCIQYVWLCVYNLEKELTNKWDKTVRDELDHWQERRGEKQQRGRRF